MFDHFDTKHSSETAQLADLYDLVVVGAGVAGLNALYAATEYLPKGARVLLIDQKDMAGGMWNVAYDYVRLHQPHPMFTVGDLKWGWNKPPSYLAKRDEVRDHLASALAPISDRVRLDLRFGHTVTGCEDVRAEDGYRAAVTFHANGDAEESVTVQATRAIHAPGLDYRLAEPLVFSNGHVISILPQDLLETLAAHPGRPVYVVGGGKTGMDTILATLAENPEREVTLINGRGTNFLNRTKYLPNGLKRWTSGMLISRLFRDLALTFDGLNEDHLIDHFRRQHSSDPDSANGVFLYGLQSEEERARIEAGLAQRHDGYLEDVEGPAEAPVMRLRGGQRVDVPAGSIFVNCTGSFFRSPEKAHVHPFLSPQGTVMSINARDGFHFLTSVAGFFATHLLYRGQLANAGFYTLDLEELFRRNRNAWVGASSAQAYMNQVIAVQILPMMLLDRCALDFDRWYPLPRRIAGLIRMKSTAQADIAHCRGVLERVADRFEVRCAPV